MKISLKWLNMLVLLSATGCGSDFDRLFFDDFNRADSASLGSDWIEDASSDFFEISGNRVRPVSDYGSAYFKDTIDRKRVKLSVDVLISGGTGDSEQAHLVARASGTDSGAAQDYYLCSILNGSLIISKRFNSSTTVLETGTVTLPDADGTQFELEFELKGNRLECEVSGAAEETLIVTDDSIPPGGYYGMGGGDNSDRIYLDNFEIERD